MALLGAPTTRAHYPAAAEMNLRKAYLDFLNGLEKFYPKYYNVHGSNIKIERDAVYAGVGTYQPLAEGEAPTYDSGQEAWTKSYTHVGRGLGIQVTKVAMQDDPHGVVRSMSRQGGNIADMAGYTMERDSLDLFNTYLTSGTVYTAGGTGYSLLSTTHYRVDGSTWSNRPTNAMDLSIEALEYMLSHWMVNQVNQRGQVLMTTPRMLLVGANDGPLAERLLGTSSRPTSADNDINIIRRRNLELVVHPLLTNDGRWLAFGPKEKTGLNYFERWGPNVERWPDGDNGNLRLVGWYRESHGATHVSNVWGSP